MATTMTYKEAAQKALDIQDACNLSGVLHSFAGAIGAVWAEARERGEGTEWVNRNPVVTLFLDKLAQLNGIQVDFVAVIAAYEAVGLIVCKEQEVDKLSSL